MLQILNSILITIDNLIIFIYHSFVSIINLLTHLPDYINFMTTSVNVLPSVVIPFAIASISIGVVMFVVSLVK